MTNESLLDTDQLNEGLNRLSSTEQDEINLIIANVENQQRFRSQIEEVGHHRVQHLLDKAFPDQNVSTQEFRRSLGHKLIEEQGIDEGRRIIHHAPNRTVRLEEFDGLRKDYTADS